MPTPELHIDTLVIHGDGDAPRPAGAAVMPIFQSSVFEYRGKIEDGEKLRYPRYTNLPDQEELARKLAALEGGEDAVVTATGMAAISTALLTVAGDGGHLLVQDGVYGGTHAFLKEVAPSLGVAWDVVDGNDPDSWRSKMRANTRALYVESLTNPLVRVADLRAAVDFARRHGLASIVDNTFASPVNFRAAAFGFDVVLHSCTKCLNGHSDLVAGAVIGSSSWIARIRRRLHLLGGSIDPHACFLLHRGIKTLALRVRQQNAGALEIARFLRGRSEVAALYYPGLESDPDHERARELFHGAGGVLSFELRGGAAAAERFLDRVRIPIVGPSLGGVETLVTRPVLTSHRDLTAAERARSGITDGLIRLSVGIEDPRDLVADLAAALEAGS